MLATSNIERSSLQDAARWKDDQRAVSPLAPRKVLNATVDGSRSGDPKQHQERRRLASRITGAEPAEMKGTTPPNTLVFQQLDRILKSKTFIQSEKLSRFLRFVVEHVLFGDPSCLKEYVIGVEVYDRKPPYDPSQDSIVRTEARRLRNKLKEYYEADGKEDPVYIYLRPGNYVPAFQSRADLAGLPNAAETDAGLPIGSSSIVIAVLPFTDISGNSVSAAYARGVPDELTYVLMRDDSYKVISPFSTACLAAMGLDVASAMRKVDAHIAFEGSVRTEGQTLRVTARIINATGVQLWVKRIDVEVVADTSFAIEQDLATAIVAGFDVVRTVALTPACAQS